jgi:23S rRNA (cytosine1962-C5)-methyltransferase
MMNTITLKPGHERRLLNFHPWVFRDDVANGETEEDIDGDVDSNVDGNIDGETNGETDSEVSSESSSESSGESNVERPEDRNARWKPTKISGKGAHKGHKKGPGKATGKSLGQQVEPTPLTAASAPGLGKVLTAGGQFVGIAYLNPQASVPARIVSWRDEAIDLAFYRRKLREAHARRMGRIHNSNAMRLVNAEGDGLPGLIVDRFADTLSVQFRNAGIETQRELIVEALRLETGASAAFERSDTSERQKEGLAGRTGVLWGTVPDRVAFSEDELNLEFSIRDGQKTGYYLDQRDNRRLMRQLVANWTASSPRLLDIYSYTGAFSLHAALAGASTLAIDKDPLALATLEAVARKNKLNNVGMRLGDAEKVLNTLLSEGKRFSHAVIDPPTLAKRKDEVSNAKRIFSNIAKTVLKMLEPGGYLLVSSCAFYLRLEDLVEVMRYAGADAGRRLEVIEATFQPADHPWIVQIPESLYLKSLIVRAE